MTYFELVGYATDYALTPSKQHWLILEAALAEYKSTVPCELVPLIQGVILRPQDQRGPRKLQNYIREYRAQRSEVMPETMIAMIRLEAGVSRAW